MLQNWYSSALSYQLKKTQNQASHQQDPAWTNNFSPPDKQQGRKGPLNFNQKWMFDRQYSGMTCFVGNGKQFSFNSSTQKDLEL